MFPSHDRVVTTRRPTTNRNISGNFDIVNAASIANNKRAQTINKKINKTLNRIENKRLNPRHRSRLIDRIGQLENQQRRLQHDRRIINKAKRNTISPNMMRSTISQVANNNIISIQDNTRLGRQREQARNMIGQQDIPSSKMPTPNGNNQPNPFDYGNDVGIDSWDQANPMSYTTNLGSAESGGGVNQIQPMEQTNMNARQIVTGKQLSIPTSLP